MRALSSSRCSEWYTPFLYAEAARRVLGAIDLDPASCELANSVIKATRFYSREQDGLSLPWLGRIFLNPPFGVQVGLFVGKLLAEHRAGSVEAAIVLCAARTETRWFRPLLDHTLCFPSQRIRFWTARGTGAAPFSPAVAYLGRDDASFIRVFESFGPVMRRVDA
jgi:ParB family chromosome partitioning protein